MVEALRERHRRGGSMAGGTGAGRFGVELAPFGRVLAAEATALATPHAAGALPENQPDAPARRAPA